jgi:PhzF family phenazine biosynthesis protein
VDAFTDRLFGGNPAGVCLLESELPAETLQMIAFENNLAETAFVLSKGGEFSLRWFTPELEMDLCGHATLAAACVLMDCLPVSADTVSFSTLSGVLTVRRGGNGLYVMDFPSRMPVPVPVPPLLEEALGCTVSEAYRSRDLVAVTDSEDTVRSLAPNIELIRKISSELAFAVAVTAPGDSCDFVSRFFAPNAGIFEDPVTGSAHSELIPLWHKKLGKAAMLARQLSKRGGTLYCEDAGERVFIGGRAVCYLRGEIFV